MKVLNKFFAPHLLFFLLLSQRVGSQAPAVYDVTAYGAVPDGKMICTNYIQKAIDTCARNGGGKVLFPAGKFLTGPLFLRSNIEIEVAAGAILLGSENIEDYPSIDGKWEGIERKVYASLFTGHNLENVSITGRGVLDGQGKVWWDAQQVTSDIRKQHNIKEREPENPEGTPLRWPRPRMINLYNCQHVLIRDLTLLDSPSWTIHPVYCNNVTIENITIIQPYESPNTDGINPESSQNVRILGCYVDCGDDCIAIKSGYNRDGRRVNIPSENIIIANCTFAHGRSAVAIGSETSGGIRNVVVTNCIFKGTNRGLRVKTQRGRGNVVEGLRATNIIMEQVGTGISLNMFYGDKDESPHQVSEETPHFRNIHYSHITGTELKKAVEILGLPEAPMKNVSFTDIYLQAESGISCAFTEDVTFRNVEVIASAGPALAIRKSARIELDNVKAEIGGMDQPLIAFEGVKEGYVHDCLSPASSGVFLKLVGKENSDIKTANNRSSRSLK